MYVWLYVVCIHFYGWYCIVSAIDQIFGSEAEKVSLKVRFWQQVDLILERFDIKGVEELRSGPTDIDISSLYTM